MTRICDGFAKVVAANVAPAPQWRPSVRPHDGSTTMDATTPARSSRAGAFPSLRLPRASLLARIPRR